MTVAPSPDATRFPRWLYSGALLVSAAVVAMALVSWLGASAEVEQPPYMVFVMAIYAGPSALALIMAALSWNRPLTGFGPRVILALVAAIWGLILLNLQVASLVLSRGGAA